MTTTLPNGEVLTASWSATASPASFDTVVPVHHNGAVIAENLRHGRRHPSSRCHLADPRVETKPMFGNLAAFVNGNMFMGLFGADIGLKLPDDARRELLAVDGARPFGPAERPMSGYVTVPAGWADDPAQAGPWVSRALEHVAALPPKKGRSSR